MQELTANNAFKIAKRIHDSLIKLGYKHEQGEFDSYYKKDENDKLMLTNTVFNEDFTGFIDKWQLASHTRIDERKHLRLFVPDKKYYVLLFVITPDGRIR